MEVLLAAHKLFHVIAPELDDMVVYLGCQVLTAFQGSDFEGRDRKGIFKYEIVSHDSCTPLSNK